MKRLILLDGNSLLNRAYFALPPLMNKDGIYTNGIYGFCMMLYKIIDDYKPTHMSVAFDLKAPTFRHKEYKDYKSQRKGMPEELRMQLEPMKEILDAMGIDRTEIQGFEADDIIGTISKLGEENGFDVIIVTGDKDALQLASEKTTILITKKGLTELDSYNTNDVISKYNLTPTQFIDLKGLMGDQSDNIPGVAGIGEKTGIKLLTDFGTMENIFENIENIKGSTREKLENAKEIALLSKKLATIVRDIPIKFDEEELILNKQNNRKLRELFSNLELKRLLSKIDKVGEVEETDTNKKSKNILKENYNVKSINELEDSKEIIIKTVFEKGNIKEKRLIGYYLKSDGIYYYGNESEINVLKDIILNKKPRISGYILKEDINVLSEYGIKLNNIDYDLSIAEYLLDSSSSTYSPSSISSKYIQEKIEDMENILGKGKKEISPFFADKAVIDKYYCDVLTLIEYTKPVIIETLCDLGMYDLFKNVEIKLISILADMEQEGILLDIEILKDLQKKYNIILSDYEDKIYGFAKEKFNINSPKQLGVVLFEKLGLKHGKKTKNGYSTGIEVLESLRGDHEIIEYIIGYRKITKLQSTYVEGLLGIVSSERPRVHTTFNQTITTTGRISSMEPNLQNIPVRTEEGRALRKVFVAKEGYTLIDADYSQIELRVLAHMSDDEKMISGFMDNIDIHLKTAAEVFGVKLNEVTKEMRGAAKAVNFGIVYGISDFGLSNNLGISLKEAKIYINDYLKNYPKIKNYLDEVIGSATKLGYSTTILGRRRYIPELKSNNGIIKKLGNRLAMNTPIQGSAADIIKLAMIAVYEFLEKENYDAKLILQIHDELIIEAKEDIAKELSLKIQDIMKNVLKMKVDLDVDVEIGKSWYDSK
ncbi:MAG: DNA polymerase I [Filifactoraceae bacterium]